MKNIFKKNQIIITALAIMIAVAGYLNFLGDEDYAGDMAANADVNDMAEVGDISQEDMTEDEVLANNEAILNEMLAQSTDENGEIQSQDADGPEGPEETGTETTESTVKSTENAESTTENTGESTLNGTKTASNESEIGEATLVNATTNVDLISAAKLNREQLRSKNKELLMDIIENSGVSETQKSEAVSAMVEMTEIAEKELEAETLLQAKGFEDAVVSISEDMVDVVINEESLSDAQRAQIEDIVKRKTGVEGKNIVITPIAK